MQNVLALHSIINYLENHPVDFLYDDLQELDDAFVDSTRVLGTILREHLTASALTFEMSRIDK